MAATSPTHIQNGEQQTVSVSGERPAPVRPGPERLRLAFRRLSRGWHEFFLSGPGTDFAVYPPPERPVVVEEAGANVAGDQLAVAASGPLRRDGSDEGGHRGGGKGCESQGEEDVQAAHAAPPPPGNARGRRRIWA